MPDKSQSSASLIKIHSIGGVVCLLIAGSSVYFAGHSISNRRGVFLSARHELESTRSELNETISHRTTLASRVHALEQETAQHPELVSIKMLNTRTAEIVELAESVHIQVDSLQPGERITDQKVPVQPLEFRSMSNADDVFAFLGLMSESMPDIHIQSVDLLRGSMDSPEVQLIMQMYWFNDPADQSP